MNTHSIFSTSTSKEKEAYEQRKELIDKEITILLKDIHKDMEKELKDMIASGVDRAKALEVITQKQERLQLEAISTYKLILQEKMKEPTSENHPNINNP